jgi:hypothetical protein
MATHNNFTVATNVKVYFCDPHSPWQRGTNENTNRLLRQYFPRGTDLSRYSQSDLDKIALRLNQRPRETLGFQTPADRLGASVALTREASSKMQALSRPQPVTHFRGSNVKDAACRESLKIRMP